jgi:hypothetical protein
MSRRLGFAGINSESIKFIAISDSISHAISFPERMILHGEWQIANPLVEAA